MSEQNGRRNPEAETENLGFLSVFKTIGWFFSLIFTLGAMLIWTLFLAVVGAAENIFNYDRKPKIDKAKFWAQVYACLVEFHGFTAERAEKAMMDKRKEVVLSMQSKNQTLIYYSQPFDVANDIAGFNVRLSQEDWQERYVKKILGK